MKKNLLYIALLAVGLSAASCNKYLDIQPVGTVIPTTESDFRALMVSAYTAYPAHKSILNLRTDELLVDEWSADISSIKDHYLWNDQNPDPNTLPMAWERLYQTIFYANHVIAEAEKKAGNSTNVQQIRAEAYLLRAYAHFELLNTYADQYNPATASTDRGVPISIKIDLEQLFEPATVEQVYQQIFEDLKQAELLLQETDSAPQVKYRFSKRAFYAFESRIRLYRGEWALAAAAADQALAINADLENLNEESSKLPNHYQSKEMIQAWENVANPTITRSTFLDPEFLKKYSAGDLRVARYFQRVGGEIKIFKGGSDQFKSTFRNAELYLTKAEAAARLGQKEEAIKSLTTLLKNRLTAEAFAAAQSQLASFSAEQLLTYSLEERAREFAVEGLRWYDLKRTSRPQIVHEFNFKSYTLNQNDPRYIVRYPKEAISNNPNL